MISPGNAKLADQKQRSTKDKTGDVRLNHEHRKDRGDMNGEEEQGSGTGVGSGDGLGHEKLRQKVGGRAYSGSCARINLLMHSCPARIVTLSFIMAAIEQKLHPEPDCILKK